MGTLDYNRSENASRPWVNLGYFSQASGKSYYHVRCPFCRAEFKAYAWSIRGGGKRCEDTSCEAMLTSFGETYPVSGREDGPSHQAAAQPEERET